MELDNRCPFCGGNCQRDRQMSDIVYFQCEKGFKCRIYNNVWSEDDRENIKRLHQIYLFMKKSPSKFRFCYDENLGGSEIDDSNSVNVAELMKSYPKSFMDQMEKSLYNLSKAYPLYGYIFGEEFEMIHLLYCEGMEYKKYATEVSGILDILCELGYLAHDLSNYHITAKGWEKVSEMEQTESNNQGFIAMSFSDKTKTISESFKKAISRCGYIPRRIDEKEHNNQIVPEILFEISRSKFVVVDVTYPNYGAYYEAGYAEALGKEVIICCCEDVFNSDKKPHFDIAQKSSIVWKDEKDLENRLYRRIEATVGLNK